MTYEQLKAEIFDNYENKHSNILMEYEISQVIAEKIVEKYDTSSLTTQEVKQLVEDIKKKEIDDFLEFTKRHKELLDSKLNHFDKIKALMEIYDDGNLSTKQLEQLKFRLSRAIFDYETSKTLEKLAKNLGLIKWFSRLEYWKQNKYCWLCPKRLEKYS